MRAINPVMHGIGRDGHLDKYHARDQGRILQKILFFFLSLLSLISIKKVGINPNFFMEKKESLDMIKVRILCNMRPRAPSHSNS